MTTRETETSTALSDERLREMIDAARYYDGANGYDPDPKEVIAVCETLIALRSAGEAVAPDKRPANCRNRLRDEGKAYPKSGCASCKNGGIMGCPHERAASPASPHPADAVGVTEEMVRAACDEYERQEDGVRIRFGAMDAALRAALASVPAPVGDGVTVKPLDWEYYFQGEDLRGGETTMADTVLGLYQVWGDGAWSDPHNFHNPGRERGIEHGKAAAQAHYDASIRSALVASPSPGWSQGIEAAEGVLDEVMAAAAEAAEALALDTAETGRRAILLEAIRDDIRALRKQEGE